MTASPIFAAARDQWAAMSRDFADYREAQIATALADTNGVLTNALGRVTGKSAEDLFSGPRAVAQRFACPSSSSGGTRTDHDDHRVRGPVVRLRRAGRVSTSAPQVPVLYYSSS